MNLLHKTAKELEQSLKAMNRASRTISEINRKPAMFFDWLAGRDITDPGRITQEIVRAWQMAIYQSLSARGEPYSVAYQNSLLGAVKTYLAFLTDSGYIVANPAKTIQYARQPRTLPRSILTLPEVRKIMTATQVYTRVSIDDLKAVHASVIPVRKTKNNLDLWVNMGMFVGIRELFKKDPP